MRDGVMRGLQPINSLTAYYALVGTSYIDLRIVLCLLTSPCVVDAMEGPSESEGAILKPGALINKVLKKEPTKVGWGCMGLG